MGGGHVVYIVDADAGAREGLCRLVRSAGFEARSFGTIDELLTELHSPASGCILLDIAAPAAGSPDLQDALRARGVRLPVIAISARHDAATRRRARKLGSSLFMSKPIDDHALLDAIEWVIEVAPNGTTG